MSLCRVAPCKAYYFKKQKHFYSIKLIKGKGKASVNLYHWVVFKLPEI